MRDALRGFVLHCGRPLTVVTVGVERHRGAGGAGPLSSEARRHAVEAWRACTTSRVRTARSPPVARRGGATTTPASRA